MPKIEMSESDLSQMRVDAETREARAAGEVLAAAIQFYGSQSDEDGAILETVSVVYGEARTASQAASRHWDDWQAGLADGPVAQKKKARR